LTIEDATEGRQEARFPPLAEYRYELADGRQIVKARIPLPGPKQKRFEWRPAPNSVRVRLYREDEFVAALAEGKTGYLVEGEHDAETCWALGIPATTTPHRAKELGPWWRVFEGADIVVVADNDQNPSAKNASALMDAQADSLKGVAKSVTRKRPPAKYKDLTELAEATGSVDGLIDADRFAKDAVDLGKAFVKLSEIQQRPVEWVLPNRIPRRMPTLVFGDGGVGKSTVFRWLAVHVAAGAEDHGWQFPKGKVAILTEEPLQEVAAPLLYHTCDVFGIDRAAVTESVYLLDLGVWLPGFGLADQSGEQDVERFAAFAADNEIALVVIDPVVLFMDEKVNTNSARDVTRLLERLTSRSGAACVYTVHLRKEGTGQAQHRASGSAAFVNVARSALAVSRDPDDDTKRILAVAKTNLAPEGTPSLAFAFEQDRYMLPDGRSIAVPKLVWLGNSELTAQQLLAEGGGSSKETQAKHLLQAYLKDGPQLREKVMELVTGAVKCSEQIVYNASAALGVVKKKQGFGGKYEWSLPGPGEDGRITVPASTKRRR
jgi:hypothetical protein